MADIDATFMQQILDIAKGKWKPDIHHHRQADDLRRRFEVTEWAGFFHSKTLSLALPVSSQILLKEPQKLPFSITEKVG
jgi:hypothetical protein